jgi:uncharacterized RDD family membrane protein YckC
MSESNSPPELIIARWSDRFFAWLIDVLIIWSVIMIIISSSFGTINFDWEEPNWYWQAVNYIPESLVFFVYWTVLEYQTGQSIGKKILNVKVVTLEGQKPSPMSVGICSFGKAFLLPLDVILGWIFTNQKRQRIFKKISDTVVIKIKEKEKNINEISYKKD